GDKDRRHGQVDGGAVEVEGVTGGDHQADHGLGAAQVLQFGHHARQYRLGRGGAEHDQQLFPDVADELEDAETAELGYGAEHDENEEETGQVEAAHEHPQLGQGAEPELADGEGHGAEGADRSGLHDDPDDAEQGVGDLVDDPEDRLAPLAEHGKRKTEQDGEEEHLEDVTLGKGVHHAAGDDVEEEVGRGGGRGLGGDGGQSLGIQLGDIGVHAYAGLDHVDHHQSDRQGQGRDDLEIKERLGADPADLLHVLHARDAGHDGTEDHRRDDHLDQLDEAVAQGFHGRAGFRGEMAENNTDRDRG